MPKRERRTPLEGASRLRAHLQATKQSAYAFSKRHRLDRVTVQRLLNGERSRISVDLAWLIQCATAGRHVVRWTSWLTPDVAQAKRVAA